MFPLLIFSIVILFTFFDRGGIPFLSHAVGFVAIGALFIFHIFIQKGGEKQKRVSLAHLLFALYVVFFILSLVFSKTPEYGFTELLSVVLWFIAFLFVAEGGFSRTKPGFLKAVFAFLLGLSLFIGVIAFIFLPFERFTGPFLNFGKLFEVYPNDYATILLLTLPFSLYFAFCNGNRWFQNIFLILGSLSLSALFLTFSRAAFVALLVTFILGLFLIAASRSWSWFSRVKQTRIMALIVLAILFTGGFLFVRSQYERLVTLRERFDITTYEASSGVKDRLEFWRASLKMAKRAPLFGQGPVSFKFLFPRYQKTFGIAQDQPHNFYLKTAAENGIPALIAFVVFLGFLLYAFLKKFWRVRREESGKILFVTALSVTAVVLQNFVDDTLHFVSNGVVFFGLLGFLAFQTQEFLPNIRWRANLSFITAILLIPLLILTVSEFRLNVLFKQGKAAFEAGDYTESRMKLEKAKSLFFKRDLRLHLGALYERLYEIKQDREVLRAFRRLLREGRKRESRNAEFQFLRGKFYLLAGEPRLALTSFQKALRRDSKNSLKYHYFFHNTRAFLQLPFKKTDVQALLTTYWPLLQKNAHFTITSENPSYGAKLYELLIAYTSNPIEREAFRQEYEAYRALWASEGEKFVKRFRYAAPSMAEAK